MNELPTRRMFTALPSGESSGVERWDSPGAAGATSGMNSARATVSQRRGFTLTELLVVLAVIAVLMGLLLPAVQAVREAARNMQCRNNLKQLGLAFANYESTHGVLPGGVGRYGCCWGTWQVAVLPFMEQSALAEQYQNFGGHDPGPRYDNPVNLPVTTQRIAILTCPSDSNGTTPEGMSKHNYAVNYGNTTYSQTAFEGVPFLGAPFRAYTRSETIDSPTPGQPITAFAYRFGRNVSLAAITDGTSNTLAAAEVLQGRPGDSRGLTWWGGASGIVTSLRPNTDEIDVVAGGGCVPTSQPSMPCSDQLGASQPRRMASRSSHPGGVNVVRCDGSVGQIADTIDGQVWEALGSARGGEVASTTK